MPSIKMLCPNCDTKLRLTLEDDEDVECPACGETFTPEVVEKPRQSKKAGGKKEVEASSKQYRRKAPSRSKMPLIIGISVGTVLVAGVIVALVIGLGGSKEKLQAKNSLSTVSTSPTRKPPSPPQSVPTRPSKVESPTVQPTPTPPDMPPDDVPPPPMPPEVQPQQPVIMQPVRPRAGDDVFDRVAKFKPMGPLPELPPLPPIERRPLLVLDPGGHTAFVKHVFFTPAGTRVISVSDDKSIRWWDVASGEPLQTVRLPAGPDIEGTPFGAAMSSDGVRLAVGGFPFQRGKLGIPVYILSVETGELLDAILGASDTIRALDFSPDGKQIAVGCLDGTVQVYDFTTKKWGFQVAAHTKMLKHVKFHPNKALLASMSYDQEVKIWDLTKKVPVAEIPLKEQIPNTMDWKSDGSALGVGCTNGEMQTFDLTGKQLKVLPPEREGKAAIQIVRMKFVPGDDKFLFCGVSSRGWAGVRDTAGVKPPTIIQDHTNTVMALNVTSDGLLAVSAGGDNNEIFVWSIRDGSIITKFQPASKGLWSVGWSQDGKTLAWGSTNRHRGDGICQTEMTFHLNDFLMGLPPQNQSDFNIHLRTEGDFSIKVNNFSQFTVSENGKELYQHNSRSDRIYSVSFMPGHGIIVGASGRIYLLDTKTGKLIREYFGDRGLTTAVTPSPNGRYFATASTDQVLRIWSPESSDPILSIFTVGREWIAWTPQGYYTCSATGERLIAWQVNNGIDRLPSVHPAARFHASLFQPALLKYLIPTGDLRLSLAMANKFEKQQIVATGLEDVLPPKVTIKAPDTANLKPITVKATAVGSDKNPIVSMKLLIDGRPYRGNAGVVRIDKKANAEATWEVALEGGSHTLAVIAESPVSKGMSQSVAVKSTAPILKPNLYILAIGVSQYPGALKLNYAASDALLLSSTLQKKSKSLFTNIEIRVITDKQATKSGIREGLDWLKEKMTTRDIGIVSFSGHGGRDEDTGKFYLIPVDAGPDFESTCLSGEELKTRLEDMPGRLVAILDACHSGSVTEIKPAKADNLVRDLVTDDCGVVVLASSLGSEFSLESSLTKAGLYTLGLTEGMNGRADFNRDGVVFINELSLYASIRVQQLSGGRQNPTIGRPPNIRPFAIAKP